jgi:hypothetical protein
MLLQGQVRLWISDAARRAQALTQAGDEPISAVLSRICDYDSGWSKNVVTDYGRRRLVANDWGVSADLFISECNAPGDVRRTSLGFIYGVGPQIIVPSLNDFNRPTLLQTRTGTFAAVGVARTINIVGLTVRTTTDSDGYVNGILAYTKLTSPVVQGAAQTADVQYRVTWSLD